jgi:hypothetical protein
MLNILIAQGGFSYPNTHTSICGHYKESEIELKELTKILVRNPSSYWRYHVCDDNGLLKIR